MSGQGKSGRTASAEQVDTFALRRPSSRRRPAALFPFGIGKCRFDHVAYTLPGTTVELDQPHSLDRVEVLRSRTDCNAGQQDRTLVVPERCRLSHDVLT